MMLTTGNDRVVVVHYATGPAGVPFRTEAVTDGGSSMELPAGSMWNPVYLLKTFAECFQAAGEGTIVVPGPWADEGWVEAAQDAGWAVGTGTLQREEGRWCSFKALGQPTIHLCRFDLTAGDDRTPLLRPDMAPAEVARVLARWHEVTGAAFRGSPGTTGTHLLRYMVKSPRGRGGLLWLDRKVRDDGHHVRGMGDLYVSRPLTPAETLTCRYVHGYDTVAQYMAAGTTVLLPHGGLSYREPPVYDPKLGAGFWRARAEDLPAYLWDRTTTVPVLEESRIQDGTVWLSTPIMEYLSKGYGVHPEPLGAYLADKSSRVLEMWARRMFQYRVRFTGDDVLTMTAKRTANETIGMMGREGGRCSRPDWRWLVIDQARVNLLRKVDLVRPAAVKVDAVWLPTDVADPAEYAALIGLRIGTALGCVRHIGTKTVSEWTGDMP